MVFSMEKWRKKLDRHVCLQFNMLKENYINFNVLSIFFRLDVWEIFLGLSVLNR